MSSLTYINEHGAGQKHSDLGHYSQAVVIGNIAKLSGQGGWDNDGNLDQYDWKQQIDNAFENVDRVLRAAGFRGWEDVYLLRSYQLDIDNQWEFLVEALRNRIPGHRPLWTALSVPRLAFPAMSVELEVEAIRHES
ncbi:hypothetical protein MBLNU13_g00732t1 [Cladosporium sp. NU13]